MSTSLFDSTGNDQSSDKTPLVPVWANGTHKKKTVEFIQWFKNRKSTLEDLYKDDIDNYRNNLAWYLGEYDKTLEYTMSIRGATGNRNVPLAKKIIPVIISHLSDLTEEHVSHMSQFKGSVMVMPTNNEHGDRISADLSGLVIKHIFRMNNFEDLLIQSQRWKRVFGEIFLCIDWDPAKGDKKPKGEGRIGDVTFSLREPSRFLLEPRRIYSEIRDCIEIHDIIHVEEARKRFNDKTIMPDNSKKIYDYNGSPEEKREEEVVVYRYIYKPDEFLPEGLVRFIVGEKVVDEAEKYPFSHADFPWERLTDIDAPTRVRGISSYQYLKPIQHQYNKITSLISRNIFMVAHPKIMMPEGAAKVESMGNSMTAVTFRGPTPPAVVNFQPNPPEAYAYRERMLTEMQQISGEHGISRGQPPPGVRAGIALQFLEEQERKGRNTHIVKHNDFILRVAKKAIGVFADYAKPDDERMIRILGKNNQYSIYSLQGAKLSGPYDIQIQNATAFSESYAGRISQIIELQQNIPGLLSREQIADVLEFGQAEKFYDIATASTRSAEAENEEMLQDRDVKDPEVWENLIVHWKTHMTAIQSRYFKENVPPSVQQRFFMHILATETLLEEQAAKSPALLQQVLALPEFPAFLELEPPPQPVIDPNTGAPVGAGQGMSPQEIPPGEPAGTEELSPQGEIPPEGPPIQ